MSNSMFEFIVWGKPRVQGANARGKADWKNQVNQAAPRPDGLLEGPLRLRIDYFFRVATDLDTDNIITPIQNALEGRLYDDDKAIEEVRARKINLDERTVDLAGAPDDLRAALEDPPGDFVFIRVAARPPQVAFPLGWMSDE